MCGISGYFGKSPLNQDRINATLKAMHHRGPDHQAFESRSIGEFSTSLLHARLAIIDLDARSNQPFRIDTTVIVFNGEIYNYLELKDELVKRGVKLRTESDTEILLNYYLIFGENCVDYFEGMWSFAILDELNQKLVLSRDRFGEKPLFYTFKHGSFFFGSEVKFLSALIGEKLPINYNHLYRYLINGYKSLFKSDQEFFDGVYELPSGTIATVDKTGLHTRKYWSPKIETRQMSLNDAIDGFRHRFRESIKIRLRADVPLAACLSGGVDSSAIVSMAIKELGCEVATFSIIDRDPKYNEEDNIRATVADLGCKNVMIHPERGDFWGRISSLVRSHDSPISTISYYVHSLLSQEIGARGFKVAFSGTGADELLTGYYDHFLLHLAQMHSRPDYKKYLDDWTTFILPLVRDPHLRDSSRYIVNPQERGHIYQGSSEYRSLLNVDFNEHFSEIRFCDSLLRNRMCNEMFFESIPVLLREDDLNSMIYSIENRSPYLDSRLFEFCYSIPEEYLIREGYNKFVLREALKGILNDKVRLTREKKGFNASLNTLVDLGNKDIQEFILGSEKLVGIVDRKKIQPLLTDTVSNSLGKFLFNLINVKVFLEIFD